MQNSRAIFIPIRIRNETRRRAADSAVARQGEVDKVSFLMRMGTISRYSLALALACVFLLSACGFQLRGVTELSFKSLHIQGNTLSIERDLKQSLKSNGIQIVKTSEGAELLLELLGETYEKRILSLSGGGLVREFELNYAVKFRTREAASPTWGTVQTVQSRRDFSYDDKALLGKAEEEAMLITDMHRDAVRELLRRLSAVKLSTK